jgi:hypothetical protein
VPGTSTSARADTGSKSISSLAECWATLRNAQLRLTGHLESKLQGRCAGCHERPMAPRILRSQAHVIVLPGLWTASHLFASPMTRLTPTATQSTKINSQSIIERP